jgi:hypothetical protein
MEEDEEEEEEETKSTTTSSKPILEKVKDTVEKATDKVEQGLKDLKVHDEKEEEKK